MCKCPECDSSSRKRISRNFLLKLIPKAKYYKCYRCKSKFLSIPYLYTSIVFRKGKKENDREIVKENNLVTD